MRTITLLCAALLLFACKQTTKPTPPKNLMLDAGGIVRADTTQKQLSLVFTAHEYADGYETLRTTLKKHGIKGAFFLTGDFYRNPDFAPVIEGLKTDGHYLGAHSDKHLLYCAWEKRDSLLVTHNQFTQDLKANYREMERFGIKNSDAPYFLPPYEWYNDSISAWTADMGLCLINYTGGTLSNGDYTTPDMPHYYSSDTIFNRILHYEQTAPNGLNGFMLLTHLGVDPKRSDKFYLRMDALIDSLTKRGYKIVPLQTLLK